MDRVPTTVRQVCKEDRKTTIPGGRAHVREGQNFLPMGEGAKGIDRACLLSDVWRIGNIDLNPTGNSLMFCRSLVLRLLNIRSALSLFCNHSAPSVGTVAN